MNIDSFILIGGRSSRLGRNKAVVEFGRRTLAQRAFQTTVDALPTSRVTFVAANEAQFGIEAINSGGPLIFDLVPDRGPLGGLHAALAYAQTPWIFVLACDYPFVSSEVIEFLADRISDEFSAIIPEQNDGRLQPLCAFYKTETSRPIVEEIIDRSRVPPPLHEIMKRLDPLIVNFSEFEHLEGSSDLFINVNTIQELDNAREIERKLSAQK
jgi:molybdopterin-guanine dinucleotide biosynthesis protein A